MTTMQTEKLLQEFPPVSTESWEEAIRADLEGADYGKKLIWQSPEGLAVKSYYRAEDTAELQAGDRSSLAASGARCIGDWRIREEIEAEDPAEARVAAQRAVAAGAEEISFLNMVLDDEPDVRMLFAGLPAIPLHLENASQSLIPLLLECSGTCRERSTISTGRSPLEDLAFAASVLQSAPAAFIPFMVDGGTIGECGGTALEEIGYPIAAGIEFLREMQERGIEIGRAAGSIAFSFSIGASFFFQVGKLRAFRWLWARVIESFGGDREKVKARIYARTSRWNQTIYDPHVNIVRSTTEAMSAVMGGADSICVAPFDGCYKVADDASRRLARNTQLILKHEGMLARVADPGAGSYCLEMITDFLAREGWKLMQRIEAAGGYTKACSEGLLNDALREGAALRERAVTSRRLVLTGTNQYANPAERALDRVEPLHASDLRRGAEVYEHLRLRTERHAANAGKMPRFMMAEFGDKKMRAARSHFAANLFACSGFDIVSQRFTTANEIAESDADVIVLCSSDPEYLGMAGEVTKQLKAMGRETPVIVAGNPDSVERLRAAGVADFIHAHSNPIEVLTAWQQRLGVKP